MIIIVITITNYYYYDYCYCYCYYRESYEQQLAADKYNYDIWFDYIRLEENQGNIGIIITIIIINI